MKNLIIIGAGGFAREVYWNAQKTEGFNSDWKIKGFLDGDVKLSDEDYKKLPEGVAVLGDVDNYEICNDDVFTCAVGTPEVRKKLIEKMLNRGAKFINLISRNANILPTVKIGNGVMIWFNSFISDNVQIGDYSLISASTIIGHDVKIGKYCCIMAHVDVNGWSEVGDNVFIGSHAAICPKSKIEDNAYIGIGSIVLKKVRAGKKVFAQAAIEF